MKTMIYINKGIAMRNVITNEYKPGVYWSVYSQGCYQTTPKTRPNKGLSYSSPPRTIGPLFWRGKQKEQVTTETNTPAVTSHPVCTGFEMKSFPLKKGWYEIWKISRFPQLWSLFNFRSTSSERTEYLFGYKLLYTMSHKSLVGFK